MSVTIDFVYPNLKAVELLEKNLKNATITVLKKIEVNNGTGIKFIGEYNDQPVSLVLYFNKSKGTSSKIVVEKFPTNKLERLKELCESVIKSEEKPIPIHSAITIADKNDQERIKKALSDSIFTYSETNKTDHMEYSAKVQHNEQELTVTQFSTGTLLIQGVYSKTLCFVVDIIDRIKPLTEEERTLLFLPKDAQEELREEIVKKTSVAASSIPQTNDNDSSYINFLFPNDYKTLTTGDCLIEILMQQNKCLPEYNFLVAIFSKVFEGFILKILINKNFFSYSEYCDNPDIADIGNALRKKKLKKYIKDERRYGYILEKLIAVWEGSRCKEMHSDPAANMKILAMSSLDEAINKIGEIKTCMREAYEILILFELTDKDLSSTSIPISNESVDTNKNSNAEKTKPSLSIKQSVEINTDSAYIGTDESGKGDYFGPLVIAGVFLDPSTEKKLANAGVRDSKKISDARIYDYAKMIRSYLSPTQYSVVTIGPEKYNELYSRIKNLNKLLAWGHARAIENILNGCNCERAIADQFGDEKLIIEALMAKGKSIRLIQMPKAEKYTAVAAASVLAREGFLNRMSELGKSLGIELAKGASSQVEEIAKSIISKNGIEFLGKYVKLHFKTTTKIQF